MLQAAGHEPVGLDVVASPWTAAVVSVTDQPALGRLLAAHRFDAIIHGGALHKPDIARYPEQRFIDVNVSGTLNLLAAANTLKIPRFIFTSTTSLMISQRIRAEAAQAAVWLDETHSPIEPRNIYGVTKLAAEGLCHQYHQEHSLQVIILRTARFFPEEDDTLKGLSGPNLKANELLHRRATVRDMARAHLQAVERAPAIGFGLYLVSAPTPFSRADADALKTDAAAVITQHYPDAAALYDQAGWQLPRAIGRVYDGSKITRGLGFTYETSFADVLAALRAGRPSPIDHDPNYLSPQLANP